MTGIIDCDHLQLAPRGYDLGYYMAFGVRWRLDGNQPSQPVDRATPFITRHLLTGYDAVSRSTIWSRRAGCAPFIGSVTTSTRSGFPHQLLMVMKT